jgi:hypothetical protein
VFGSIVPLAAVTGGTVAIVAAVAGAVVVAADAASFVASTAGLGAAGNSELALLLVLTSTPCPAFAQGAWAGALDTVVCSLPGAATYPFDESYRVIFV